MASNSPLMQPKGFEMIRFGMVSVIQRFRRRIVTIGEVIDSCMSPVAGMRVPIPSLFALQFAAPIAIHKPAAWPANTTT